MLGALGLAAGAAFAAASCRFNWWRRRKTGLPVLMYHKIGAPPRESRLKKLWVSERDFRAQLHYLKSRGYSSVGFSDLAAAREGRRPLPEMPVLITFDDGYADAHHRAFPVLAESGMKGNLFMVAGTVGGRNSWHDPADEPRTDMLSAAQIREMQDSKVFEFGSHTMTHPVLERLADEDVRRELAESKERLEDLLGREVEAFAYPYGNGAYAPRVRRLVLEAGYRYDFGVKQGIAPWPWRPEMGPLRRLLIRGDDIAWDFHLNMTRGRARL